ncbi:MAG TPA: HEAT repeat domain-containing protein [Verrucomicrobiae bacterium]|nr:HEAT repeat domain-containing protein [Verrucomicrobiae bacterium]
MNVQIKKIVGLLKVGKPEQQMAAAIVLGELRPKDGEAVRLLGQALQGSSRPVRLVCIDALGKIALPAGLHFLMPLLEIEDGDVRARTLEALASFGPKAVPAVAKRIVDAPPPVRRALITVLSRIRGREAMEALLTVVQQAHPEASRESAQALSAVAAAIPKPERAAIRSRVEKILKGSPKKVQPATLSASLTLLGTFGDASSAPLILRLAGSGYPEAVRREALLALGAALRGTTLSPKILAGIFSLLTDRASQALTAAALEVLYRMEFPAVAGESLMALLEARDPAVRRFAARKLGSVGGVKASRRLIALLSDPDSSLRDASADSLSRLPEAAGLLLDELSRQSDVHKAWALAHILKNHAAKIPKGGLKDLTRKGIELILKDERVWEPFLHIVRHADSKLFHNSLLAEADRLKRQRKYDEAEAVLKPLLRTEQFDPEARFELALTSLKASAHREGVSPRTPDSPLDLFRQLARDAAFPLLQRLRKERIHLDSEDLYWLGFHLAEGAGDEKSLGAELLKMVSQKEGKSKLGRNARNKLRLEGLGS